MPLLHSVDRTAPRIMLFAFVAHEGVVMATGSVGLAMASGLLAGTALAFWLWHHHISPWRLA